MFRSFHQFRNLTLKTFESKLDASYYIFTEGCQNMCDGESNCYLEYNCTHYQHCFEQDGHCTCMLMTCSFGTYWNQAIHVCDSIHNVNCEKGKDNLSRYSHNLSNMIV